jgi:hypothetical protein
LAAVAVGAAGAIAVVFLAIWVVISAIDKESRTIQVVDANFYVKARYDLWGNLKALTVYRQGSEQTPEESQAGRLANQVLVDPGRGTTCSLNVDRGELRQFWHDVQDSGRAIKDDLVSLVSGSGSQEAVEFVNTMIADISGNSGEAAPSKQGPQPRPD